MGDSAARPRHGALDLFLLSVLVLVASLLGVWVIQAKRDKLLR